MQRPTRQLGRSGSMAREKRGLDPAEDEGRLPEPKRPRVPKLARYLGGGFDSVVCFERLIRS